MKCTIEFANEPRFIQRLICLLYRRQATIERLIFESNKGVIELEVSEYSIPFQSLLHQLSSLNEVINVSVKAE